MKFFTLLFALFALSASACMSGETPANTTEPVVESEMKEETPKSKKMDLLVRVTCQDYDGWKANAFDPDAPRRAEICDESRTVVSKVSNTEALVMMFDVDMDAMFMFMEDPEMKKLMEQAGVTHEVFSFEPLKH